jgi:hypothetical protein
VNIILFYSYSLCERHKKGLVTQFERFYLYFICILLDLFVFYLGFIWVLFGFYLGFIWILFGFYLGFIWVLFGFYLGFIWVLFRFYFDIALALFVGAHKKGENGRIGHPIRKMHYHLHLHLVWGIFDKAGVCVLKRE